MELRVLNYFLEVAREGSITAASNSLQVTQPTLSRQLKDLEEELGQKLFVRGSHHVTLTPEGMLLRKRAEEIMEIVYKTEDEFYSMGDDISGNVYIGGGESYAMRTIARLLRETRDEFPGIRCHLYSGTAEDVMDRLDKGLLDFGVLIQPVDISKYDHVRLPDRDTWGVVMRRDHPLTAKKTISPHDLDGEPLIASRYLIRHERVGNPYREWYGGDLNSLNVVATFNLIYNAALLVEEGIGIALTIDRLLNVTGHSELCFRPFEPRLESRLDVVWKKYQVFSPAAAVFLEKIRKESERRASDRESSGEAE